MYDGAFSLPGDDEHKMRLLGHELGHVLGFRHEFIRPEAPLGCSSPESGPWRPLTPFDQFSIMQYDCAVNMAPTFSWRDTAGAQSVYGPPPPVASDILWRNTDGTVAQWWMDGSTIEVAKYQMSPGSTWTLAGAQDFDGDLKTDLLWRLANGDVRIWRMNAGVNEEWDASFLSPGSTWQIAGTGDFNGDAMGDVLWRNTSTNEVRVWLMSGLVFYKDIVINSNQVLATTPGADWQIRGVGDFNDDGKSDILWRNTGSNVVTVWLMDGTTIVTEQSSSEVPGADWQIKGVGEFNGDGKSDILWRNNDGTVAIWLMNGGTLISAKYPAVVPGNDWQINGTGDFNADGLSDILWRNTGSNEVALWYMSSETILSQQYPVTIPGADWQIQGTGKFKQFVH